MPARVRGQLVRELGNLLREHKADLGALVSIEAGKIRSEGLGEVQEMIDICDLGVGLSRQLFGLTIASERPGHRMILLRVLQGETGTTFHGNLSWLPYVICAAASIVIAVVAVASIRKGQARRSLERDKETA